MTSERDGLFHTLAEKAREESYCCLSYLLGGHQTLFRGTPQNDEGQRIQGETKEILIRIRKERFFTMERVKLWSRFPSELMGSPQLVVFRS